MSVSPVCILGLGLMAFGWMRMLKSSLLNALQVAPPGRIHASVDRYVKLSVTASAAAGGSIREPLREQPCLWYSLRLDRYRWWREPSAQAFRPIASKATIPPFIISDESGACLVRPDSATMNVPFKDELWQRRYRYLMACVREGDRLIAIGDVQNLNPPVGGVGYELIGTKEAPLLVTTLTEAEVVRHHARASEWGLGFLMAGFAIVAMSFFV